MIEAAMIWNEPNNKSHWDPEVDPDWSKFAAMTILAADAIAAVDPTLPKVLGGMSPIDASFVQRLAGYGVLDHIDALAVHGFPLDWNLWKIDEWPAKIDEIRAVTALPVWVSEVGVSTFGADEVQVFGFDRTAELLVGKAPQIVISVQALNTRSTRGVPLWLVGPARCSSGSTDVNPRFLRP